MHDDKHSSFQSGVLTHQPTQTHTSAENELWVHILESLRVITHSVRLLIHLHLGYMILAISHLIPATSFWPPSLYSGSTSLLLPPHLPPPHPNPPPSACIWVRGCCMTLNSQATSAVFCFNWMVQLEGERQRERDYMIMNSIECLSVKPAKSDQAAVCFSV